MSSYKCHWTDCRVVLDDGSIFCKGHENLIANLRNGEMLVVAKTEYQELLAAKETLRGLEALLDSEYTIQAYIASTDKVVMRAYGWGKTEHRVIESDEVAAIRALRVKVERG